MERHDYLVGGRAARLYQLDSGEFLRVELYEDFFSLGWSSHVSSQELLRLIGSWLAGNEQARAVLYHELAQEHEEMQVKHAVQLLRESDNDVSFARLELEKMTLVWEKDNPEDPSQPGEFGLMSPAYQPELLLQLIRGSGTENLIPRAEELVEELAYLGESLPPSPKSLSRII